MPHGRRRRLTKVERLVLGFKLVIAFLLSHVGLCILVIAYTIFGALIFQVVEGPFEVNFKKHVKNACFSTEMR
uniref:Uncharacterized protein n=1 Tax=Romanomermis culicivorax TaxID=13658 RepID=A0A915L6U7_ROMCU